jgi:hypothetical protein
LEWGGGVLNFLDKGGGVLKIKVLPSGAALKSDRSLRVQHRPQARLLQEGRINNHFKLKELSVPFLAAIKDAVKSVLRIYSAHQHIPSVGEQLGATFGMLLIFRTFRTFLN